MQPSRILRFCSGLIVLAAFFAACASNRTAVNKTNCLELRGEDIPVQDSSFLIRTIAKDEVEAFAVEMAIGNEDGEDEVSRRLIEQQTAWALNQVKSVAQAADSADAIWFYDTKVKGRLGGENGLVALQECEVIAHALFTIYD